MDDANVWQFGLYSIKNLPLIVLLTKCRTCATPSELLKTYDKQIDLYIYSDIRGY